MHFAFFSFGQMSFSKYKIDITQPAQVIWGLGVEIQNDAIGSGNSGMPDKVVAIPNNLTASERKRLYKDLLKGFRYCRLAMGLYFRGLDQEEKQIIERYPNQLRDLKELIKFSGMEGICMEYWSCAPAWKSTNSYLGGTLKSRDSSFLNDFGYALVNDINYLKCHGIPIAMWGLQNEPGVGTVGNMSIGNAPKQSYSHCYYSPETYIDAFRVVAPMVKKALGKAMIIADSWDGNSGIIGKLIQKDTGLLAKVDAWVYHRIGSNSNDIINESPTYKTNTFNKPVFQNEFEYQHAITSNDFINTAQNIMNWFTFANSPTWFWLHALKPTYNAEASGYSLGFWRPYDDLDTSKFGQIKSGYWDYNPTNFNAIAGFLKYMPWNSTRYVVQEETVLNDNRIFSYKTPKGKFVFVLTNRSGKSFGFEVRGLGAKNFKGHRYTISERDLDIGIWKSATNSHLMVPNNAIEFWVEQ